MGAVLSTTVPLAEISTLLQSPDFLKAQPYRPSLSSSQTGINAPSWRLQAGAEKSVTDSPRDDDFKDEEAGRMKEDLLLTEHEEVRVSGERQLAPISASDPAASDVNRETQISNINSVGLVAGPEAPDRTEAVSQEPSVTEATESLHAPGIQSKVATGTVTCDEQPGGDVSPRPLGLLDGVSVSWLVRWCTDAVLLRDSQDMFDASNTGVDRYVFL